MTEADIKTRRQLVLASASPRRKELLAAAGFEFIVIPSSVHEPDKVRDHVGPVELAEALSFFKASSVAHTVKNATIIGADTVVAAEGRIFGKPADVDDARRILTTLMRQPHAVITGVTVLDSDSHRREITNAVTRVTMTPMPPGRLDAYLAGGLWQGKAGAYGIQDHGDEFVQKLEGSFSNVVGLPMELLTSILERWHHYAAPQRQNGL